MTREEYIRELRARIAHLPKEEREAAMSYYVEYLEDAADKSMEEIIMELGTPRDVAERIIADCAQSRRGQNSESAGCLVGLLAALTSPIWLPLLFVIGLVGFIFLFVACILIFVFGVLAVTFVGVGLWLMFVYPPTGLVMVGAGLICAALIILCIMMFVGVGSAVKLIKNTIHSRRQQI